MSFVLCGTVVVEGISKGWQAGGRGSRHRKQNNAKNGETWYTLKPSV